MIVLLLAALLAPFGSAPSHGPDTPGAVATQPTFSEVAPDGPLVLLGRRFGLRDGLDQPSSQEALLAELRVASERSAQDAGTDRITLMLGSANVRLALSAEPAVSRFLLGIAEEADRQAWGESARQALRDLARARELWEALPEPASEAEESTLDRLGESIDMLEAFAHVFLALSKPGASDTETLTGAVIGMSEFLEIEDRRVARTATLWQAVALRRLGRPERAAEMLDLPLSTPGASPLALFSRLERLWCLADVGDLEAAMVLALRMEEACGEWYQEDQTRMTQARRACSWVRLQLYRRYLQRVRERGDDAEVEAWERLCLRVRDALLEDEQPPVPVARLGKTMPLVIEYQDALLRVEEPATQPASQPADDSGSPDAAENTNEPQQPGPDAAPETAPAPAEQEAPLDTPVESDP